MELLVHLRCPHCGGWEVVEAEEHQARLERSRSDPERGPLCPICALVPWGGLIPRPEDEYERWVALCEGRAEPPAGTSSQVEVLGAFVLAIEGLLPLVSRLPPDQLKWAVQTLETADELLLSARLADAPIDHALSLVKGHVDPEEWPPELARIDAERQERAAARDRLTEAASALRAALDRVGDR